MPVCCPFWREGPVHPLFRTLCSWLRAEHGAWRTPSGCLSSRVIVLKHDAGHSRAPWLSSPSDGSRGPSDKLRDLELAPRVSSSAQASLLLPKLWPQVLSVLHAGERHASLRALARFVFPLIHLPRPCSASSKVGTRAWLGSAHSSLPLLPHTGRVPGRTARW